MDMLLEVVVILVVVGALLIPFASVLFSRRYPRQQDSPPRQEPPAE